MKSASKHAPLYRLIRSYMNAMGTSRATLVALKSYIDSIRRLRCTDGDFKPLLLELNAVIKNTEPKMIPLVHLIEAFEVEMRPHFDLGLEQAKGHAIEILSEKRKQFEADIATLTVHCMQHIKDGDFIIINSAPARIREAIVCAHTDLKRRFAVLLLEQDRLHLKALVQQLKQHRVEHYVVPENNLSHYLDAANKLFINAVSLSADHKAVTTAGTANVVSLCHAHRIPVYLFIETIKFAHTPLGNQGIYREQQIKVEADVTFHVTTFSHDFVDLTMIDHLVTEKGECTLRK